MSVSKNVREIALKTTKIDDDILTNIAVSTPLHYFEIYNGRAYKNSPIIQKQYRNQYLLYHLPNQILILLTLDGS
jgi:hypothetical protein